MSRMHAIFSPVVLLAITVLVLNGHFSRADDLFQEGLTAYQKQNFTEARDRFEKAVTKGPVTARLLHNLALTYFQLDQKPRAAALWRKALTIDPSYKAARTGRDLMETRFDMRPYERGSLSSLIRQFSESVSILHLLTLAALLSALCGWFWIRYIAERREALDGEKPLPDFPLWALFFSFLLTVGVGLIALKIDDATTVRATLVNDRVGVRSLPAEAAVSLFELSGGGEVLVRSRQPEWTQIQNSEGNTGWVKNSEIIVTSER